MIKHASDSTTRSRGRRAAGHTEELAEHYRSVLRQLPWPGGNGSPLLRTLGVTSCVGGEGVSTVAAHLAAAAASYDGCRVLLVDANLARPSLQRTLCVNPGPGLAESLLDPKPSSFNLQPSPVRDLSVLSAGEPGGGFARAYDSPALDCAVRTFKEKFELVVFDLPAAGQTGTATRLAAMLDGVVLVIEAERIAWEAARRTKELLSRAGVNLVGAVLNKRREHLPGWLYRKL